MISDNLQHAWKQYKLERKLPPLSTEEMLYMIEGSEAPASLTIRMAINVGMSLLLIMCCQGG